MKLRQRGKRNMLVYNNKEYRNLQEQVQKNKADIEDWKSKQETLANWGIRIVGQIESESDLPEDYEGEYGDAYQVGTGDTAKYFAWIRPTTEVDKDHWMDMGSLSIAGPQGPAGDEITDIKFVSSESKTVPTGDKQTDNTIRVTMSDGRTIDFTVKAYADKGDKGDQGIQGIQGVQGPKGDKGDKGDVGPQGEMGPTAPAYHIIGKIESTEQLPDPVVLKDLSGAYLIGIQLWIQIGKTLEEAKWTYLGDIDTGATGVWELSGTTIAPIEAVDLVQCNNLDVLQSFSCKNPSITGTISGSAIKSPANLSLAGTTGVDIIYNESNAISIGDSAFSIANSCTSINSTLKINTPAKYVAGSAVFNNGKMYLLGTFITSSGSNTYENMCLTSKASAAYGTNIYIDSEGTLYFEKSNITTKTSIDANTSTFGGTIYTPDIYLGNGSGTNGMPKICSGSGKNQVSVNYVYVSQAPQYANNASYGLINKLTSALKNAYSYSRKLATLDVYGDFQMYLDGVLYNFVTAHITYNATDSTYYVTGIQLNGTPISQAVSAIVATTSNHVDIQCLQQFAHNPYESNDSSLYEVTI